MDQSTPPVDQHDPPRTRLVAAVLALAVGGLLSPAATALGMWSAAADRPASNGVIARDDTMHATLEARLDAALSVAGTRRVGGGDAGVGVR